MKRIAIIGRSGGGKSSLARRLGKRLAIPVVHLDVLFWLPDWTPSAPEAFHARLSQALMAEAWITDGNFMAAADLHLAGADTVIWVDRPRLLCVGRALLRAVREHGRNRGDMAPGCDEKIDLAFLAYIWNWDRDTRPRVETAIARYAPDIPLVRLTSDAEIEAFVASL